MPPWPAAPPPRAPPGPCGPRLPGPDATRQAAVRLVGHHHRGLREPHWISSSTSRQPCTAITSAAPPTWATMAGPHQALPPLSTRRRIHGQSHAVNAAADRAANIEPMRRNASTVVVLAGSAPGAVLAAVDRSMNVTLIRPEEPADSGGDNLAAAAGALHRAGRATSPYTLVAADPLAAVAAAWRAMWDVSRLQGPAEFEQEAVKAQTAWRSGRFELPDYYLVLAAGTGAAAPGAGPGAVEHRAAGPGAREPGPDFHLGPLRSARPHRVAVVAAAEPARAGRRRPAGSRLLAARSLVAAPRRGDRDGPPLLPGQPGRRHCCPGGAPRASALNKAFHSVPS